MEITIKNFEDACQAKGLDPKTVLPNVDQFPVEHQQALLATAQLFIIAGAINEQASPGWKADWSDEDQCKYYPWFYPNSSRGFSFNGTYFDYSVTYVGSRLCFCSREAARYAGNQFMDLYRQMMLIE